MNFHDTAPNPAMSQRYFFIRKKSYLYTPTQIKNTGVNAQLYTSLSQNMQSEQPCAVCKVSSLDMKERKFPEVFLSNVAERMMIMATWTRLWLIVSMWPCVNSGELQCGEWLDTIPAALLQMDSLTLRFMLKAFKKLVCL